MSADNLELRWSLTIAPVTPTSWALASQSGWYRLTSQLNVGGTLVVNSYMYTQEVLVPMVRHLAEQLDKEAVC